MNRCAFNIRTVNNALRNAGYAEQLVRGRSYFYFVEGDAMKWPTSSVYVYRLDTYTPAQWIEQRNELAKDND